MSNYEETTTLETKVALINERLEQHMKQNIIEQDELKRTHNEIMDGIRNINDYILTQKTGVKFMSLFFGTLFACLSIFWDDIKHIIRLRP